MNNLKVQGFFLLDLDVAAPNNAGKSTVSNNDNVIAIKKAYGKDNKPYAYISGQAFGAWWRDTLQKHFNWELSPILRESKTAFTAANPFEYADDDVFGYMKAAKEAAIDEDTGEVKTKANGKEKMEDITVTRIAALRKSAVVSIGPVAIARNWSSMARQEGNAVPYFKEEFSSVMKGQFSLDLSMVGTFSNYNKTGFKNISDKLATHALENGCHEIEDPFVLNGKGLPHKLIRMPTEARVQRSIDVIQALKVISGGAMQTNNMTDVTPKFIILALMTTGNHPFGHIFTEVVVDLNKDDSEGDSGETGIFFNTGRICQVLQDYKSQIIGTVYIGKRLGFLDQYNMQLAHLEELGPDYPKVKFGSIGQCLDGFCEQMKNKMTE